MRRRDKGGAGVGGQTHAGGNVDAVVGDGHPNHVPIAKQAVENGGNAGVGGIFDPCAVAGVQQDLGGQIEPLLRAGGDEDLLRRAVYRAGTAHIVADGFAQRQRAQRIAVARRGAGAACPDAVTEPPPDIVGRGITDRHRDGERYRRQRPCPGGEARQMLRL